MTPSESIIEAVEEMLLELEDYLLSPELFWPLSSRNRSTPQDRLTLGNLVLHLDQLQAVRDSWDVRMETRFRRSELDWENAKEKWKSAISKKAGLEIRSRLNLWRAYLIDMEEGKGERYDYHHEVRNRVMIERLLGLDLESSIRQQDLLASDRMLLMLVKASEFIWPAPLKTLYPPDAYWFLYRTPRKLD